MVKFRVRAAGTEVQLQISDDPRVSGPGNYRFLKNDHSSGSDYGHFACFLDSLPMIIVRVVVGLFSRLPYL